MSSGGSSSDRICELVKKLTEAVVFKGRDDVKDADTKVEQITSYSLRILSSHIYPSIQKNDFQITEAIKRKLYTRNHSVGGLSGPDSAVKFEEQNQKLSSQRNLIREKWSVMYLLYTLSGAENTHSLSAVDIAREQSFQAAGRGLPVLSPPQDMTVSAGAETKSTDPSKSRSQALTLLQPASQKLLDQHTQCDLSESLILRDVIYNLQGIDGAHITFTTEADGFSISNKLQVHRPLRVLVRRVCEIGWMYRRVRSYIAKIMASPNKGLVEQALCGALENELTDYFRLIAVLESQLSQDAEDGSAGQSGFTLRRLFVWISEPMERMRLMAQLTDAAKGLKGGALASAIESHVRHGDGSVRTFVQRILSQLARPLFMMMERWLTVGELQDPYREFFVSSSQLDDSVFGQSYDKIWQEQYQLDKAMIPSFMSQALANKILLIGKSINFIRSACEDAKWVSETHISFEGVLSAEGSTTVALLESAINEAAEATHRRLMELILEKYKFREHVIGLKKYLLLGQGDFIQVIVDLLHTEFDKSIRGSSSPVKYMFDRNLLSVLEAAKRASQVQYEDPEVSECISIRTMVPQEGDECGWDVFSLDYVVQSPLRVIFTEEAINKYLRVFKFLWQVKRVEHCLTHTWNLHMIMKRRLSNGEGMLNRAHCVRNEMTHFIVNLHNFMMFEVLEVSWWELVDEIGEAKNLDELIKAHESYIAKIVNKALLGGDSGLTGQLKKIFREILQFCNSQQRLYDDTLAEVDLREQREREAVVMFGKGKNQKAVNLVKEKIKLPDELEKEFKNQVNFVSKKYHMLVSEFFEALRQVGLGTRMGGANQRGSNASQALANTLGFLTFRLDFNEFYSNSQKSERRASMVSSLQAS